MNRIKNGKDVGLDVCPHCGRDVEFFISGNTAYICCSDHNCLGGSHISWGGGDKPYIFIEKLKSNWNKLRFIKRHKTKTQNIGVVV